MDPADLEQNPLKLCGRINLSSFKVLLLLLTFVGGVLFWYVYVCVDVLMQTEVRGEPQVSSSVIPGPACLGRGLPLTLALRWQRASEP